MGELVFVVFVLAIVGQRLRDREWNKMWREMGHDKPPFPRPSYW